MTWVLIGQTDFDNPAGTPIDNIRFGPISAFSVVANTPVQVGTETFYAAAQSITLVSVTLALSSYQQVTSDIPEGTSIYLDVLSGGGPNPIQQSNQPGIALGNVPNASPSPSGPAVGPPVYSGQFPALIDATLPGALAPLEGAPDGLATLDGAQTLKSSQVPGDLATLDGGGHLQPGQVPPSVVIDSRSGGATAVDSTGVSGSNQGLVYDTVSGKWKPAAIVKDPGGSTQDFLVATGSGWARLAIGTTGQQIIVRADGSARYAGPVRLPVDAFASAKTSKVMGDGTDDAPAFAAASAAVGAYGVVEGTQGATYYVSTWVGAAKADVTYQGNGARLLYCSGGASDYHFAMPNYAGNYGNVVDYAFYFKGWVMDGDDLPAQSVGTITDNSNQVTNVTNIGNWNNGDAIIGPGIPHAATVSSISGTTITLSTNALAPSPAPNMTAVRIRRPGYTNGIAHTSYRAHVGGGSDYTDIAGYQNGVKPSNTTVDGSTTTGLGQPENRCIKLRVHDCGNYGVYGYDPSFASITDGFLEKNVIFNCATAAVFLSTDAGWLSEGNHCYSNGNTHTAGGTLGDYIITRSLTGRYVADYYESLIGWSSTSMQSNANTAFIGCRFRYGLFVQAGTSVTNARAVSSGSAFFTTGYIYVVNAGVQFLSNGDIFGGTNPIRFTSTGQTGQFYAAKSLYFPTGKLLDGNVDPQGANAFTFVPLGRTYAAAAPSSGTWQVGDECVNTTRTITGTSGSQYLILGWTCTTAGTPGTWTPQRALTGT